MRSFSQIWIVPPALLSVFLSAATQTARAQTLDTLDLCAPGAGEIGHSWIAIPSRTDFTTPEAICQAIPGLVSVAQGVENANGTGPRWSYDCATGACSSTQPIPEPGCTASSCFCVDPGDGIDVLPAAATTMPIHGCETFTTIRLASSVTQYLYSVPYDTSLVTVNDLVRYTGLPIGLPGTKVWNLDCATGTWSASCTAGAVSCDLMLLVRGEALKIVVLASHPTEYTFTNPIACSPIAAPAADTCPIGDLNFTGAHTFAWSAPAGCPLPLVYDAIRGDLACLRGFCTQAIAPLSFSCAGCTPLEKGDATDSAADDPALPAVGSGFWYTVRVEGGTWNHPGAGMQCTDWDFMLPPGGCP